MIRVAKAVIEKEGKILLLKRKGGKIFPEQWDFPGGKLNKN